MVFVLYPGFTALDVVGPHDVFSLATEHTARAGGHPAYTVSTAAAAPGPVRSASGLQVHADVSVSDVDDVHTLVVPGGWMAERAPLGPAAREAVRALAPRATRIAAVCTGAFSIAAEGWLADRRATTHWAWADALARAYPSVAVDPDAIFVEHGPVWTSAGVTAGIDLALAIVERDVGVAVARDLARDLVVYLRRPGGQSQYSQFLREPVEDDARIAELQRWIADHLHADLRVDRLAQRVAMSPRHFARVFRRVVGTPPARFVEACRVDAVRTALQTGDVPVATLAHRFGFGTPEGLRRAFHRAHGISPQQYRQRFGPSAGRPPAARPP